MDEYFGNQKAFVDYMKALSDYVAEAAPEKTIRMWGSLSKTGQDYSGLSRKIQLQVWDTDWTDPQEMYDAGFSVINSLSSSLYLIPGGGYDRLDLDFWKKVAAERFRNAGANLGASAVVEPDAGSLLHAVERLCIAGWK